jgi:arylsulfatase A-like enzyme
MILFNKMLKSLTYGLALLALTQMSCNDMPDNLKKPNIIIIYADDLGYGDLSTYGGNIPSPNVERIAEYGIRFTNFYVSGPVCTPSRYSLLTGRYPQRSIHDLTGALMPEDSAHIDKSEKILPEYLKKFGYRTAIFGKWHLGNMKPEYFPCNYGFDKFIGHTHGCIDYFTHVYGSLGHDWYEDCEPLCESGYSTDLITDHAIEYISDKGKDPYFVFVSYNSPHYGKSDPSNIPDNSVILNKGTRKGISFANTLQVPHKYIDRFGNVENIRERYYYAMVANLDDNIGKLMDFLEWSGQIENTVIWFISDNGGYSESNPNFNYASNGILKGQKGNLTEGGIRVPSVVCWKKIIKPGQVISQPSANIDILPTLLSILQSDFTKNNMALDGISLIPVILKDQGIGRDIFWKFDNQKAFRRGKWKLVDNQLYDLSQDMSEQSNLAEKEPDIYYELNSAWDSIFKNMDVHVIQQP